MHVLRTWDEELPPHRVCLGCEEDAAPLDRTLTTRQYLEYHSFSSGAGESGRVHDRG